MKYDVLDYIKDNQRDRHKVAHDIIVECNNLGKAFVELTSALEKLDPNNAALKKSFTRTRLKQMKDTYAAEANKRRKEKERAAAKQEVLKKLTHEEKVAFGLVKG
jgi:hypothetical protein